MRADVVQLVEAVRHSCLIVLHQQVTRERASADLVEKYAACSLGVKDVVAAHAVDILILWMVDVELSYSSNVSGIAHSRRQ